MSRRLDHARAGLTARAVQENRDDLLDEVTRSGIREKAFPRKVGPEPVKKSKRKNPKKGSGSRRNSAKIRYIDDVLTAISENRPPPKPYKKMGAKEVKAAAGAASVGAWVREQPEFQIVEQLRRTRHKNSLKSKSLENDVSRIQTEIARLETALVEVEGERKRLRANLRKKKGVLESIKRAMGM
jgi:hypothetical protein